MNVSVVVKIEKSKLEELHRSGGFQSRVSEAIEKTLDAATLQTIQNIEDRGLVLTGFMRDSVSNEMITWNEGQVVVGAYYAVLHELGTVKYRARPFLAPAIESVAEEFIYNLREALEL